MGTTHYTKLHHDNILFCHTQTHSPILWPTDDSFDSMTVFACLPFVICHSWIVVVVAVIVVVDAVWWRRVVFHSFYWWPVVVAGVDIAAAAVVGAVVAATEQDGAMDVAGATPSNPPVFAALRLVDSFSFL